MKILMLTPYLPYPPRSGGQTRSFNLIKYLGKIHEITLFSLVKDKSELQYLKQLRAYCHKVKVFSRPPKPWTLRNILRTGFSTYPFLVVRNFPDDIKKAVEEELKTEKYDLIHAENFYVMPYIPPTKIPILLAEQTIFYRTFVYYIQSLPWYMFWLKPILFIDVLKLKRWESYCWRKANCLVAVSEEDRQDIRALVPGKNVKIIPNGVDCLYFGKDIYKKDKYPTILFGAANFHWLENQDGARILIKEVWPLIKRKVNGAKLWIVGKIAPKALSGYVNMVDVTIEEIDDNREAYQKAWVEVAPLRSGGGSRTKFFEAMASGLPIVTTAEGAKGIEAINNRDLMVRNSWSEIANSTIELLENHSLAQSIGDNARRLVREEYDWKKSAKKLDQIYKDIIKNRNED